LAVGWLICTPGKQIDALSTRWYASRIRWYRAGGTHAIEHLLDLLVFISSPTASKARLSVMFSLTRTADPKSTKPTPFSVMTMLSIRSPDG